MVVCSCSYATGQEENPIKVGSNIEQQLENLTEQMEGEPEDDYYLQTLVQYRKNQLNLNIAEESDLKQLRLVTDLQIQSLLKYKRLLGNLLSIYELQAVPAWDLETIQKILPYVTVDNTIPVSADLLQRLKGGQHSFLLRTQQVLEKSNGYLRPDNLSNRYSGSNQHVFFRYKYTYRNLLQFGITADKDAGEQFFKGNQKNGFDFYSFHVFVRKLRWIKLLALGDFTVNLGQGLIHWQSLAFKKSADITSVKRQADILRPYNSAGEYNFLRGAGITVNKGAFDFTAFASMRKMDGTFNDDTTLSNDDYISTISNTGYHRTTNEIAKKNLLTQTTIGGNISYKRNNLHLGLNSVATQFSIPLVRDIQPYNQFGIQGKNWYNYSLDYSYTFRNIHFFGELAADKRNSKAIISGLLASLDPKVDFSLVYRNIEKSYQSLSGIAFTENAFPTNEKGLFTGISIKPATFLRINFHTDVFSFPWLRYRVDAPTKGSEYLLQVTYAPNKKVEIYSRFRNENKASNLSDLNLSTRQPVLRVRQNWRTQLTYNVSRQITLKSRVEKLWFDPSKQTSEQGFLAYIESRYKPFYEPVSVNGRLQFFKTDDFDSRMYSFENDVLFSYSVPQFIGKGLRYYLNINWDLTKKATVWFRWAQTIYSDKTSLSSGLDEIKGNKRSEVKLQAMIRL